MPGEPRAVGERKADEKSVLVRTPISEKPLYTATMVAPVETDAAEAEAVSGGGGPTTPPPWLRLPRSGSVVRRGRPTPRWERAGAW